MIPGGLPRDLDEESMRRVARSFYVVRMSRYAGLLVASLAVGALAVARPAPDWVAWSLAVLAAGFVVAMWRTRRRYVRSQQPRSDGPSCASPTGG